MITRDRRERAIETVRACRELPGRPPIVVVDDASSDGTTPALRATFPDVRVRRRDRNAGAAARNDGARTATTPYVAFVDDDSGWAPGALQRAADILDAHPQVAVVAARTLVGPEGREDPIVTELARGPRDPALPGPDVLGFLACAAVVRRDPFLAVGGFHPRLHLGGEEELLALDLRVAGWRAVYVAEVVATHAPDDDDPRPGRRRRQARNRLWTAWLRRRPVGALRVTATVLAGALRDPALRAGAGEAFGGLRWVVGDRAPIPADLERQRRDLERAGPAEG